MTRYGLRVILESLVRWNVDFHDEFVPEFEELDIEVQDELLAHVAVLEQFGPSLVRPRVDTLNGSRHANMKELRFVASGGVWRFLFAFDRQRAGIVLCGGDKSGASEKRFYRQLVAKADRRFEGHLASSGSTSLAVRAGRKRRP